jgi:hypothetical protein
MACGFVGCASSTERRFANSLSFAKIATVVGQIAVNPERRRDEDDSRNRRALDLR